MHVQMFVTLSEDLDPNPSACWKLPDWGTVAAEGIVLAVRTHKALGVTSHSRPCW